MMVLENAPELVGMNSKRLERIHPVMESYTERGYAGISVAIARRGQLVFKALYGVPRR